MPYRTAATVEKTYETLYALDVRVARHRNVVLALAAIAAFLGALFVVDRLRGRGLGPGDWTALLASVVVAAVATTIHRARRRSLRILRHELERRLVIDGAAVDLEFPVFRLHGEQRSFQIRGAPSYHVFLQLVDAAGNAVCLHAPRRALEGPLPEWLGDGLDSTRAGSDFDVADTSGLTELRGHIEAINAAIDPAL